jgi:hypothetical protein
MILNLIRRWIFNRNRYIYRFWNGQRIVLGDPMVLWRDLNAHEEYREDDLKLVAVEGLRDKIIGKLAKVFRDVFHVQQVGDGGLTELECVEELARFLEYSSVQKKSTELTPISSPSMEQEFLDESATSSDTVST